MSKIKIKQSKLPKDSRVTLRINKELKAALKLKGVSIQKELDKAMDNLAQVFLEIKVK